PGTHPIWRDFRRDAPLPRAARSRRNGASRSRSHCAPAHPAATLPAGKSPRAWTGSRPHVMSSIPDQRRRAVHPENSRVPGLRLVRRPQENIQMLLSVRDLTKTFHLPGGETMTAVNNVSFDLAKGDTLGVVGESGSGKSTPARLILRLHEASSGSITFDGIDVRKADAATMRQLRSRIQVVFQDPYSSLMPHYAALDNVAGPLRLHKRGNKKQRRDRARELLNMVGINPAMANRFPNEFSGGQQQRIAVARALALDPELLVCDEPTSSLDVSIQAQILNLLKDVQQKLGISMIFISHNLAVDQHLTTHVP